MVNPFQQQRNNNPSSMYRSPNNPMFPQRNTIRQDFQEPNRNNAPGILQRFIQPQSGGGVDLASKGAGGLSKTLNNVQQVLKVVQSSAPMIQEYGPMVKNLPAMYRMMKAFKDVESTDNEDKSENNAASNPQHKKSKGTNATINNDDLKPKEVEGQSTPKLFI